MSEENKSFDWNKVVSWIFGILALLGVGFGVLNYVQKTKEEELRIQAQNEIARQSQIIEEKEGLYSRLAEQNEDLVSSLEERNEEFAGIIRGKDERILTLQEVIANFEPVRIVVRPRNVIQYPDPINPERIRVEFDQTQDPLRVSGFTLTDPAEAEVEVSYVRPLGITSVLTQREDGSWNAYFETDYPNLRVEQLQTRVNPYIIEERENDFFDNVIIGGHLGLNSNLSGVTANVWALYELEDLAFGPALGASVSDDSFATFGLVFQGRPF